MEDKHMSINRSTLNSCEYLSIDTVYTDIKFEMLDYQVKIKVTK